MISYGPLAVRYDILTRDVPYGSFADYYEAEFRLNGGEFRLVLDLCCGTGTLTRLLAERGYDMIGVDSSFEMLNVARDKCASLKAPPLLLCQDAAELDLYGTVDAAVCSLDGINYIPPEYLPDVFSRLRLFVRKGGLLIFDIRSEEWLRSLDGNTSVDEDDNTLCIWRSDFYEDERLINYGIDLFTKSGKLWKRESEEHTEYAYSLDELKSLLEDSSFGNLRFDSGGPQGDVGRVFIIAERI